MFDPEDFRTLASKMLQGNCDAAIARTAIGRAYYAAFLVARQNVEPHFYLPKDASSHKEVQRAFSNCQSGHLRDIGSKLDDLRSIRDDADYDLENELVNGRGTAQLHNGISSRVIRSVKEAFDERNKAVTLAEMIAGAKLSGSPRTR